MKLYLAGPMHGIELYNFPAFHDATEKLRANGHTVWSAAENDEREGFNPATDIARPMREYMCADLPAMLSCEAVVLLPGWDRSRGVKVELFVAIECGLRIMTLADALGLPVVVSVKSDNH